MKHPDKNTVSYTSVSTLYFDETKSKGSEFDNFTFLSLLDMVSNLLYFINRHAKKFVK